MERFISRDNLRAEEIHEDLLYRTGLVFTHQDSSRARGLFDLPQLIETSAGKSLLETEEDVAQVFENVLAYYNRNGVTELIRTVVKAEFLTAKTIGATHVSRLMLADGSLYRKPYPTYSILRETRDGWKIASTAYAILDSDEHNRALLIQPHGSDAISLESSG